MVDMCFAKELLDWHLWKNRLSFASYIFAYFNEFVLILSHSPGGFNDNR